MNNLPLNIGLLIYRIAISLFMMIGHGWGKLLKLISGEEIKFLDPFGLGATISFSLAVFAEFFASAFIILGLFNRISNLSLIITMSVAAFIAHADDPFAGKEKALLFLIGYILLFLTGPGKYSLATIMNKKLSNSNKFLKTLLS